MSTEEGRESWERESPTPAGLPTTESPGLFPPRQHGQEEEGKSGCQPLVLLPSPAPSPLGERAREPSSQITPRTADQKTATPRLDTQTSTATTPSPPLFHSPEVSVSPQTRNPRPGPKGQTPQLPQPQASQIAPPRPPSLNLTGTSPSPSRKPRASETTTATEEMREILGEEPEPNDSPQGPRNWPPLPPAITRESPSSTLSQGETPPKWFNGQAVWALYRGKKNGRAEVFPATIRNLDPLVIEYPEEEGGGWEFLDTDEQRKRLRQRCEEDTKPPAWLLPPFLSVTYDKCPIQKGKEKQMSEYSTEQKVWALFKPPGRAPATVLPGVIRHTNPIVVQTQEGWEILGKKEKLKRIKPRTPGQPTPKPWKIRKFQSDVWDRPPTQFVPGLHPKQTNLSPHRRRKATRRKEQPDESESSHETTCSESTESDATDSEENTSHDTDASGALTSCSSESEEDKPARQNEGRRTQKTQLNPKTGKNHAHPPNTTSPEPVISTGYPDIATTREQRTETTPFFFF